MLLVALIVAASMVAVLGLFNVVLVTMRRRQKKGARANGSAAEHVPPPEAKHACAAVHETKGTDAVPRAQRLASRKMRWPQNTRLSLVSCSARTTVAAYDAACEPSTVTSTSVCASEHKGAQPYHHMYSTPSLVDRL